MIGSSLIFALIFTSICIAINLLLGYFTPYTVFESEEKCRICYHIDSNFYLALSFLCGIVEIIIFFTICGIGIDITHFISSLIKFLLTALLAALCASCNVAFMIFSAIVGEYLRTRRVKKRLAKNDFVIIDDREEKSKKDL